MMEEGINYRRRFFQHNNGVIYRLVDYCKSQVEGVWQDFVLYRDVSGELYSRSKEDFFLRKIQIVE